MKSLSNMLIVVTMVVENYVRREERVDIYLLHGEKPWNI